VKKKLNLIVDSGNTLTKISLFDGYTLVNSWVTDSPASFPMEKIISENKIGYSIISDVTGRIDGLVENIKATLPVLLMTSKIPVPIKITYNTPETLGTDRIAGAVYANHFFPGVDTLVIQAGTCITYDVVLRNGEFTGGLITPGVEMRFKSMNTFTAKLPLVKKQEIEYITGTDTQQAILSGVNNGCLAETDGIIDRYRALFPGLVVIFGGGDTFFFDKRLKNRIFATANLVTCGLNIILEHNKINV